MHTAVRIPEDNIDRFVIVEDDMVAGIAINGRVRDFRTHRHGSEDRGHLRRVVDDMVERAAVRTVVALCGMSS
jgi:hypothetical protein